MYELIACLDRLHVYRYLFLRRLRLRFSVTHRSQMSILSSQPVPYEPGYYLGINIERWSCRSTTHSCTAPTYLAAWMSDRLHM